MGQGRDDVPENGLSKANPMTTTYYARENYYEQVHRLFAETDTIIDIGPGIRPVTSFKPKLHIMLEAHQEYVDILQYRYDGVKSVIIIRGLAQDMLPRLADNSIDSIFLLDIIEHIEKDVGLDIIQHAERIARQQIIVFTPLGFMPQHVESGSGEKDGWGLSGAQYQEHLSGWTPDDFSDGWDFHICKDIHDIDFRGQRFAEPYGAFYAIKNFRNKSTAIPSFIADIRSPMPIEIELAAANNQLNLVEAKISEQQLRISLLTHELDMANRIINHPAVQMLLRLRRGLKCIWK